MRSAAAGGQVEGYPGHLWGRGRLRLRTVARLARRWTRGEACNARGLGRGIVGPGPGRGERACKRGGWVACLQERRALALGERMHACPQPSVAAGQGGPVLACAAFLTSREALEPPFIDLAAISRSLVI
jgi:hypothetical protein